MITCITFRHSDIHLEGFQLIFDHFISNYLIADLFREMVFLLGPEGIKLAPIFLET